MLVPVAALALCLAGAAAPAAADAVQAVLRPAQAQPPYAPDERMEFRIEFLGMKAGSARISVGRPVGPILPVFLEARTSGFAGIVDVREQLASYLDSDTGLPRTASVDSVEPGYRRTDTTRFDREVGKATVRSRGRNDRTHEVPVPPDTVDFIAMVFRLRTLPLVPGTTHEFQVLAGTKVMPIAVEVQGREPIDTGAGRIPAVRVRVPTGFTGKFSEKRPTFVWFSDDDRRIVVRIAADFAMGRATAQLVSYAPGQR